MWRVWVAPTTANEEASVYEIRVVRENGESELCYVDEPVLVGERLRLDGRRLIVLKRVRPSNRESEAAFICLEVPAPQARWLRSRRAA
jgi:hypothetical protein